MISTEKEQLYSIVSGIIQYCIEKEFIENVDTIWEIVCDETDTDYNNYDGEIGMIFDEIISDYNL